MVDLIDVVRDQERDGTEEVSPGLTVTCCD